MLDHIDRWFENSTKNNNIATLNNKNNQYHIAPLTTHLQPQVQTVDVDKDAQFHCIVSGHPVHEVNWLHDGKPIIRDNRIEVSI